MEKNSFNNMAPVLWNKLDNDCKESASIVYVTSFPSANVVFVLSAIFTICKQDF